MVAKNYTNKSTLALSTNRLIRFLCDVDEFIFKSVTIAVKDLCGYKKITIQWYTQAVSSRPMLRKWRKTLCRMRWEFSHSAHRSGSSLLHNNMSELKVHGCHTSKFNLYLISMTRVSQRYRRILYTFVQDRQLVSISLLRQ